MTGYWMHETSGVLRPAVEAYLWRRPMTLEQIAAMRAYLRQWIASPQWRGGRIDELRAAVDGLATRRAIRAWIDIAVEEGIDPL
jgi:hypothetical protein